MRDEGLVKVFRLFLCIHDVELVVSEFSGLSDNVTLAEVLQVFLVKYLRILGRIFQYSTWCIGALSGIESHVQICA